MNFFIDVLYHVSKLYNYNLIFSELLPVLIPMLSHYDVPQSLPLLLSSPSLGEEQGQKLVQDRWTPVPYKPIVFVHGEDNSQS